MQNAFIEGLFTWTKMDVHHLSSLLSPTSSKFSYLVLGWLVFVLIIG